MITFTTFSIIIILFIIGCLCLFFGKTSNPFWDVTGFICIIVAFIMAMCHYSEQQIDLPEEYKEITIKDTLQGYYQDDVLHIEFNNTKRSK